MELHKKNIAAIIVTYFPDEEIVGRLQKINKQVDRVIVVDNKSYPYMGKAFDTIKGLSNVSFIQNEENLGMASALNIGIRKAVEFGYSWVLMLDQDSIVSDDLIESLIEAYCQCPYRSAVAMVGTNVQEDVTGITTVIRSRVSDCWLEVEQVITSGTLLSLDVYHKLGPFRDDLFIDLVDFEYCLRVRASGFKVINSSKVGLIQTYGNLKIKKLLGLPIVIRDYPPLRCYYRTRNAIIIIRQYFFHEPRWCLFRAILIFGRLCSIAILEDQKLHKIKISLIGILHGIIMKTGIYQ